MLGLGAYESSSEDEAGPPTSLLVPEHKKKEQPVEILQAKDNYIQAGTHQNKISQKTTSNAEPAGPVLGPSDIQMAQPSADPSPTGQSSPFLASRTLIHDLTLPPVPNLDIPPSPPGSPEPMANAKFTHFLSLKKQGIHFNEKLAGSTSLKNPSLLKKLMDHAGIDGQAQYHTSLPIGVWDTANLPQWGFKEALLKSQQEIRQQTEDKRLAGHRGSIEFVTSTAGRPNQS